MRRGEGQITANERWSLFSEVELSFFRSKSRNLEFRKKLVNGLFATQSSPTYKRFNEALMKGIKDTVMSGYDLYLNPLDEFARTADWFIAECRKRMDAVKP